MGPPTLACAWLCVAQHMAVAGAAPLRAAATRLATSDRASAACRAYGSAISRTVGWGLIAVLQTTLLYVLVPNHESAFFTGMCAWGQEGRGEAGLGSIHTKHLCCLPTAVAPAAQRRTHRRHHLLPSARVCCDACCLQRGA